MENLFKEMAQKIRIFMGISIIEDPYEKNSSETLLHSIPLRAIISDVSPASSVWKMPGIVSEKTKQIIIEKKYESLLKQSQKIRIDGEDYYGYKVNGRLSYTIEQDYLRAYVYIKKES